jgi:hypothetical protein
VKDALPPVNTGGRYSKPYSLTSMKEVSEIKRKEEKGIKRMNLNVPVELHNSFKAATAAQGLDMTTVLLEFIEDYVSKQGATQSKKGKRG